MITSEFINKKTIEFVENGGIIKKLLPIKPTYFITIYPKSYNTIINSIEIYIKPQWSVN